MLYPELPVAILLDEVWGMLVGLEPLPGDRLKLATFGNASFPSPLTQLPRGLLCPMKLHHRALPQPNNYF